MIKTVTIKSSRDFTRTYNKGTSFGDRLLGIYVLPNRENINKIGISIGKKVGKSVHRNHVKRLIRESYRRLENKLKTGFNIMFVPRPLSKDASYFEINNSIIKLFRKHNLFLKDVIE